MGSAFGGHLALAGHDVTLVDLRRDHMEAVLENGLLMRSPNADDVIVRLGATSDPATLEPVDAVIVLVKSYATEDAIRSIKHAVTPSTWVATVQNGLGNDAALARVLGPEHVIPGTTTVGAEQHGVGETTMNLATATRTSLTQFGAPRGTTEIPQDVRDLAKTLSDAGLPTQAVNSADVVIWTKLALAGCMGPTSALLRRTVRDTIENPDSAALLLAMFEEIVAVAHALHIPLNREETLAHQHAIFEATGPHVASMAADVLAHRRTEIDAFCGEVVRLGDAHGVPTPVNETMWRLIRTIESTYDSALRDSVSG
jgi:2-dehydropantoate 2-reductase